MRTDQDDDFGSGPGTSLLGVKNTFGKALILSVVWLTTSILCATIAFGSEDNSSTTQTTTTLTDCHGFRCRWRRFTKPSKLVSTPTAARPTHKSWNFTKKLAEREEQFMDRISQDAKMFSMPMMHARERIASDTKEIGDHYENFSQQVSDEVHWMSNKTHDAETQCESCEQVATIAVEAGVGHECAAACVAAAAASGPAAVLLGAVCGQICNAIEHKACNKMVESGNCVQKVCEEVLSCPKQAPQSSPQSLRLISNGTDDAQTNCEKCEHIATIAVNAGVGHECAAACVSAAGASGPGGAILGAFCGKFCNMLQHKACNKMIDSGDCVQKLCEEARFCPKKPSTDVPLLT